MNHTFPLRVIHHTVIQYASKITTKLGTAIKMVVAGAAVQLAR
jgi:hypothetical protein